MKIKFSAALMAMMFATSAFADGDHYHPKSVASIRSYTNDESDKSLPSLDTVKAQTPTVGKTREQVERELIEAERAGLVPYVRTDYPPSQATIRRNQAHFSVVEKYWASRQQ
jgi:hypothetical protein